jgi:tape measure domain-containing protein
LTKVIDRKEVELLVRAKLQGKGDLASITKSIVELEKAIDSQALAAKRGEGSVDGLRATLLALQTVQDRLKSKADLIGTFERQSAAIEKTADRVETARIAYQAYEAKLKALSEVTDKQQERLIKLSASYDRAQASLAKQRATLAEVTTSLKEAEIATDNLAGAEREVREAAAQLGVSISKTQAAISTYADDMARARQATKAQKEEMAEATRIADLFAAAEKRAADAAAARARSAQEVAATRAARLQGNAERTVESNVQRGIFDEQAESARRTATAAEFVRRWAASLKEADEAADTLAKNNGLAKTADDATAAARGYNTLARASSDLRPKVLSIRDAIEAINDPAATTRATLSGVEGEVAKLGAAIGAIRGPVRDYKEQFRALAEAGRSIASQGGLVDQFRQQVVALREARTAFSAARAQVTEYANAVRQGGDAGEKFVKPLAEAQARLRSSAQSLRDQVVATREARSALRDAGIASNDLATAETRLTSTARAAASATRELGDAVNRYGTAAEGAGKKSKNLFGDEGRTTLSLVQRIRGEVLALAAAYVGLQGGIGLAKSSIDAFNTREGAKNQLAISVGSDRKIIDAEYAYVRAQADRIGIEFESAIKGYAKFSAAATLAGRSRQEIRSIFETFSELGRVANLSKDDLQGVFKALEQITSKGKIQAEELRGQLGDRLFGAFQVAAQSLKDVFPDLDKALKDGLVTSDQLVVIAEQYRKIVANELPAAQQSLAAEQMRFNNAVFDFKALIADGGFADAYKNALLEINTFLKSDDGKKFAQSLSDGFSALARAVVFVLTHLDELKTILMVLGSIWAGNQLKSFVLDTISLGKALQGAGVAGGALNKVFAGLQAFFIGFSIGTYLNDNFEAVRKFGVALVVGFELTWTGIRVGAKLLFAEIPRFAQNAGAFILNTFTKVARDLLNVFRIGSRALGLTGLTDALSTAIDALTFKYESQGAKAKQVTAELKKELDDIRQIGLDMLKDAERNASAAAGKPTLATPTPATKKKTAKKEATPEEIARRQALIESIRGELESLDASIDRAASQTLSQQLTAIDTQYEKLQRKIGTLGKNDKEGLKFAATLERLKGEKKLLVTRGFNQELLNEQEALQSKLEAVDAAAGRKDKTSLDARLQAVSDSYAATYRDIATLRQRLVANNLSTEPADLAKERLDLGVQEIKRLETQKFYKDEIARREAEINELLSVREARAKSIADQEALGLITSEQAKQQTADLVKSLQPELERMAASGIAFATSIQGAFDPTRLADFIARLQIATAGTKKLSDAFVLTGKTVDEMIATGAVNAIDKSAASVADAAVGAKSWGEAFRDVGKAFINFAAEFLRKIAEMILQQIILNQLSRLGLGASIGAGATSTVAATAVAHSGMIVGAVASRTRAVPAAWFNNAPRYHSGTGVGMARDEYRAILQEGEEVLSKGDPRNAMNGGAALHPDGTGTTSNRFVLVDDSRSAIEAMAGVAGENVTMVHVRKNISTIRQLVKG